MSRPAQPPAARLVVLEHGCVRAAPSHSLPRRQMRGFIPEDHAFWKEENSQRPAGPPEWIRPDSRHSTVLVVTMVRCDVAGPDGNLTDPSNKDVKPLQTGLEQGGLVCPVIVLSAFGTGPPPPAPVARTLLSVPTGTDTHTPGWGALHWGISQFLSICNLY